MTGADLDKIFGGQGRKVLWCEGRWNLYIQTSAATIFCNLLHQCEESDIDPTDMDLIGLHHPDSCVGFEECESCLTPIPEHVQTIAILYCSTIGEARGGGYKNV
jgi:hypothetical protein